MATTRAHRDRATAPVAAEPARTVRHQGEAGGLADLQARAGNHAVCEWLGRAQAKLEVGAVHDPLEAEADRVADQVVASLGGTPPTSAPTTSAPTPSATAQRAADPSGPAGGPLDRSTESAVHAARSGGAPLAGHARDSMEHAFGADFSAVRVHTGASASTLGDRMGARAFTVGSDIFFNGSGPDTTSAAGQHLLAHELSHVVQQGGA